jgi:non-ribosomal peptide synthetase-like protein
VLGPGTFLGNHAVVPGGGVWPDRLFVGVATVPPREAAEAGSAWFGLPALRLPRREVVALDRRLTHDPDLARFLTRALFEAARCALPIVPFLALVLWLLGAAPSGGPLETAARVGLATLGAAALPVLCAILGKWLLLGRVRPGRHAFWSGWCARWDLVYMLWDAWARAPLAALEGTPYLRGALRLFGLRVGRGAVLGPGFAQVVDPDMIAIEAGATVCGDFQAHTFEDRVLKIDRLRVGEGATVGDGAVLFYGVRVGAGARLAPHSIVMKNESLPADGDYEGAPARPAPDPDEGVASSTSVLAMRLAK